MPPKKKVLAVVKIQLPAGGATPAPPVGTALGPHGVQTMEFCKQYNAATENQRGTVVPVEITIYEDRSFTFVLKTPPTPVLIRQAAGIEKGAAAAGREQAGSITDAQLTEIATGEAARPEHRRPRSGQAPGGGHGPLHGRRRQRLICAPAPETPRGIRRAQRQEVPGRAWSGSTASSCTRPAEAVDLVKDWPRPSSTRPSSWPSASGSTPARPTRSSGAP